MDYMLNSALEYAQQRHQFGQPIANFQMIRQKIAHIRVNVDAARLLSYRAAWLLDEGLEATIESAVAKLFLTEAAVSAPQQ